MRRILLSLALVGVAACAKKDSPPAADSSAMTTPPAPTMNLANMAGTWNMQVMPQDRDTVLLNYVITATGTTEGWTLTFPGRDPIPMRITQVAGDSIVSDAGPYESALRKGVQVNTTTVNRMQGNTLVGTTVARYTAGPDTVLYLRQRGTKAP